MKMNFRGLATSVLAAGAGAGAQQVQQVRQALLEPVPLQQVGQPVLQLVQEQVGKLQVVVKVP